MAIPHICHFDYTNAFGGLKLVTFNIATKIGFNYQNGAKIVCRIYTLCAILYNLWKIKQKSLLRSLWNKSSHSHIFYTNTVATNMSYDPGHGSENWK